MENELIFKIKESNLLKKVLFFPLLLMMAPFLMVTGPLIFSMREDQITSVKDRQLLMLENKKAEVSNIFNFVNNSVSSMAKDDSITLAFDGEMFKGTITSMLQAAMVTTPQMSGFSVLNSEFKPAVTFPESLESKLNAELGNLKGKVDANSENPQYINFKNDVAVVKSIIRSKVVKGFVVAWVTHEKMATLLPFKDKKDVEVSASWDAEDKTGSSLGANSNYKNIWVSGTLDVGSLKFPVKLAQDKDLMLQSVNSGTFKASLMAFLVLVLAGLFLAMFVRRVDESVSILIKALDDESDHLRNSSDDLVKISNHLLDSNNGVRAIVHESAAAIDEMKTMMEKTLDAAKISTEASAQSAQASVDGKNIIEKMQNVIKEVNVSNQDVADSIKHNSNDFSKMADLIAMVSEKTKVIDEIVLQTKLLAFNASVEAARAGSAGSGFAVVAKEVGELAAMSGQASKQIADLLDQSVSSVNETIKKANDEVAKVIELNAKSSSESSTVASDCMGAFDQIAGYVDSVDGHLKDIAVATKEQYRGVDELRKAIGTTEETVHLSEKVASETAEASRAIKQQSDKLAEAAKQLRVLMKGHQQKGA